MLDDIKMLHERDAQDALGIAERQWQQLEYKFDIPQGSISAENIVISAMGSSAAAANMVSMWLDCIVPLDIVQSYDIPAYVSNQTYFIAISSSGNNQEALSAVAQAEERGAQIAIIAGGGRLVELARQKNYPLILLPNFEQARYGKLYAIKALAGLLAQTDKLQELEAATDFVQQSVKTWIPTANTAKNLAKQIALEVIGTSVVIYSGPNLAPAAQSWKVGFNENAKHVAWLGQYPEANHGELLGWSKQPVDKPYAVIDLRSNLEHPKVQQSFEINERLLSGLRPSPVIVDVQGSTYLEQLLWTIVLGDFVTIYTALLNGLNPTPTELISKFKKLLET